jgi:hypothetical protein
MIDTGTDFSQNSAGTGGLVETSFEGGNFPIATTYFASARGQTVSSVRLDSRIIDGSSPTSETEGNLYLVFLAFETSAFALNEFQARYTFPQTVAGEIGFINGFDVVSGQTTPGFENAFDFAFDGAGSITITPNGSFTAVENTTYTLALDLTVTPVPEPATAGLLVALIAGGLVACRRRRA